MSYKEDVVGVFRISILVFIIIAVLGIGIGALSLTGKLTLGVASRNADAQIFKQSEQYNDGMANDLAGIEQQWISATPTQRETLRSLVLHRFASYDKTKLPPDLQQFYNELKNYSSSK